MNQNDLRVKKTRKNIESAFIALLKEKDFHKITVQDILDRALINRSTFYKHYMDKYQLAETLCDEVFKFLKTAVRERFDCDTTEHILMVLKPVYQILSDRKEEILALFSIHTESIHLYEDMYDFLQKSFYERQKMTNRKSLELLDYLSNLYAALVLTAMKWCLKNEGYEELTRHTQLFQHLKKVFDYPGE